MEKKLFFVHLSEKGMAAPDKFFPVNMQQWFTVMPESEEITIAAARYNSRKIAVASEKKSQIPLF